MEEILLIIFTQNGFEKLGYKNMTNETFKSVETQKEVWPATINNEYGGKLYSYGWGDPASDKAVNAGGTVLGNYKKIKDEYIPGRMTSKTVVEIGCFDGKWTQQLLQARRLIVVDIIQEALDFIAKKYPFSNIRHYLTAGDELTGIPSGSTDFVFSMDSLVRSEYGIIDAYVREIKRVLRYDGQACIHLPCQQQPLSHELGFTQIDIDDICAMCDQAGIKNYSFDPTTINHGVLLLVNI